jgi:hypothetical protein
MRFLLKHLGLLLVLVGVLFLIIPFFARFQTNASLLAGGLLVSAGFILYIILNKFIH